LHKALSFITSARKFDSVPLVPVVPVLVWVKERHKVLTHNKLVPVYVFDGARHNMKKVTDSKREKEREKALEALRKLKASPSVHDRKEADELRRKITYPREDVLALIIEWFSSEGICFFSAPFEAE
jgi:5'-3' exonuclease